MRYISNPTRESVTNAVEQIASGWMDRKAGPEGDGPVQIGLLMVAVELLADIRDELRKEAAK